MGILKRILEKWKLVHTFAAAMLIVVIPLLVVLTSLHLIEIKRNTHQDYAYLEEQTEKAIRDSIVMSENAFALYSKALDDKLESDFKIFLDAYKEADDKPEKIPLKEIQQELGKGYDLYIIDKNGKVVRTTYEPDKGLDFTNYPDFYQFLEKVRTGNSFHSPRISGETQTGKLRKFAYMPTPDNKYVLEIGLFLEDYAEITGAVDYLDVERKFKDNNPFIQSIRIMDRNGFVLNAENKKVSERVQEIIEQMKKTQKTHVIEYPEKNIKKRYLFVQADYSYYTYEAARIVEITYNMDFITSKIQESFISSGIISIIAVFIAIFVALGASLQITGPIRRIVSDVDTIAKGNLNHTIDVPAYGEMQVLKESINIMVGKMRSNIRQIADYNEKLESANKKLETKITEQEETEKKLRKSERNYREVFENMQEGLYRCDAEGQFILVNGQLAEILGCENVDYLYSKNIAEFRESEMHNGQQHSPDKFFQKLNLLGSIKNHESTWIRKDGSRLIVSENVHTVRSDDGTLQYYEGTVDNITERKTLERQLVETQKMEGLGQIAAGIAHDFNNVLAAISGAVQMLEMLEEGEDPAEYVEMISSSIERARSITERLLTFARTERPETAPFPLKDFYHEMRELGIHTLPKQVHIAIGDVPEEAYIYADKTQFQQIFLNMFVNSSAAMEDESGTITVSAFYAPQSRAEANLEKPEGRYVCLQITDNGKGMDEETKKRIFEPFFTTKERGKGTGLGLSVVYKILQNHGGWIEVESEPGQGTTFTLGVPLSEQKAVWEKSSENGKQAHVESGHVLLVDDEEQLRALAERMLKKKGYEVTLAADGEEALGIFQEKQQKIDVVFTDLGMPGMPGKEVAKRIKEIKSDVPIVAVTGYVETEDIDALEEYGITSIIKKPFSYSELLDKVAEVLGKG